MLRAYLIWENHRRDKTTSTAEVAEFNETQDTMINLMDKTDKEIPQFRYVY